MSADIISPRSEYREQDYEKFLLIKTNTALEAGQKPGIGYAKTHGNSPLWETYRERSGQGTMCRKIHNPAATSKDVQYALLYELYEPCSHRQEQKMAACRHFSVLACDYRAKARSEMKRSGIEPARRRDIEPSSAEKQSGIEPARRR